MTCANTYTRAKQSSHAHRAAQGGADVGPAGPPFYGGVCAMREFLSSREFWWPLIGAAVGFGYNRLGVLAHST